jgi:hypothetical protein
MVSRGDKKPSPYRPKRKIGAVEALLADPVDLSTTKAEKASLKNFLGKRKPTVVSAIVYDKKPEVVFFQNVPETRRRNKAVADSPNGSLNLTFTTKLRNVIEYIFENLRDMIAHSSPPSKDIEKSLREMRALNGSAENRLNEEIKRHLIELIEETEAFVRGEKTGLTGVTDFQSALHYRHYVRIAWLSNYILSNVTGPVSEKPGQDAPDFPPNL